MTELSETPRGRRRNRRAHARDQAPEPITDPEKAREIALGILTRASRSTAQLRDGLVAKHVVPDLADAIVERYVEVGLVDDAGLAATIVRTRHAERGQSRRAIRVELARKGFDEDAIGSALDQIDDDDERERAAALARRRWDQLAAHPVDVRERRVVAMLGRKGYSSSLAFALVKHLRDADSEDD
ncbi:regulatory protein RecX [Demequina sp. SYSU T00192]|uniref:Regulatory protein RecX n=1 Tax=Demequina litoralis TaxID=3051660 RepID=A0ABT8GAJ0_9MICO|nr:regulatory protein RecX [Demequina sp. SYSU T00192]MDN4476156.1 regulatory protein RecX [Demequina sp. SYSU T00192]